MTETTLTTYPQISVLNPPLSSRRNGKIARLPKESRDIINRMLDDGIPYHVIIDELGEAGEVLNTQNLTNWNKAVTRSGSKASSSSSKPAPRPKLPLIYCAEPTASLPQKLSTPVTWSALRNCCMLCLIMVTKP